MVLLGLDDHGFGELVDDLAQVVEDGLVEEVIHSLHAGSAVDLEVDHFEVVVACQSTHSEV